MKAYSITTREFATAFRDGFEAMRGDWPNVPVDHGPLTLMQGWIDFDPDPFERDALVLVERFKRLSPLIDRLLASQRK